MNKQNNFVKVKNLEIGKMYGGWRNWYIYMGRTKDKGFMWIYIGNPEAYLVDPISEIKWSVYRYEYGICITKQNKKIELSEGELGLVTLDISTLPDTIMKYLGLKGLDLAQYRK